MSPSSLLILLLLIGSARPFFMSRFFDGSRQDFRTRVSPSGRAYREELRPSLFEIEMEQSKPKRYKPCFYSPIQCLIRK